MKPHSIVTLKSYKKAMAGLQAKKWYIVCKTKYDSQVAWGTFTIIILLYDYKAIKEKWVFKLKENSDGSIEKYKAKWVAKKYWHVEGHDYKKTYASVICYNRSRVLLAISVKLE